MAKYASKVVAQAKSWIGCKESDGTHKQIIDVYNSHKPLARGYKVKYTDSWCATFVSAVSIKCGYTDIIPTECSCQKMIALFQNLGAWNESDSRVPNAGDIIFYDWQDNGVGDNVGNSEHVGIVEKVSGKTITVIEGNYSDSVKSRTLTVNDRYIRGYGVPKYDSESAKPTTNSIPTTNATTPTTTNTTKPTSTNSGLIDTAKEVQQWANTNYKAGLVVDGIYGAKTKKALVKILQTEINQTYNGKLVVDGIWGTKTKSACPTLRKGTKNDVVKVLQGLLVCNGYPKAYVDGDYGSGTYDSVKSYQSKKGLTVDGIAGKNTFAKLCS